MAWDALVRTYWKRVFNIAYKFVAQYDEAEDLTQEIFVKLFRALPTYDRRAQFDTWLTRVSRNLCIDYYRRRHREEEKVIDDIDPDSIPIGELVSRPDVTLEQRAEVAMVRQALAKLPPTSREPVALRDIHELSYEEIAERLRLPEGTVKSRINRGRPELARHLQVLLKGPKRSRRTKDGHDVTKTRFIPLESSVHGTRRHPATPAYSNKLS